MHVNDGLQRATLSPVYAVMCTTDQRHFNIQSTHIHVLVISATIRPLIICIFRYWSLQSTAYPRSSGHVLGLVKVYRHDFPDFHIQCFLTYLSHLQWFDGDFAGVLRSNMLSLKNWVAILWW